VVLALGAPCFLGRVRRRILDAAVAQVLGIRVLACRCGWRRTVGVGHPSHPSFFRLPSTLDQVATKVDAAMCQIKAQHALTSRKDLYQDCRRIKPCMAWLNALPSFRVFISFGLLRFINRQLCLASHLFSVCFNVCTQIEVCFHVCSPLRISLIKPTHAALAFSDEEFYSMCWTILAQFSINTQFRWFLTAAAAVAFSVVGAWRSEFPEMIRQHACHISAVVIINRLLCFLVATMSLYQPSSYTTLNHRSNPC